MVKAAVVCCSNGLAPSSREQMILLKETLERVGIEPVFSEYIYARDSSGSCGTARERARVLMDFYRNPEIQVIFDVSGGDMANGILPFLDFQVIGESRKLFWGYSDLTVIINAVYARTGRPSVLYQVRNLLYSHRDRQITDFRRTLMERKDDLYRFSYDFLRGSHLKGVVVGGNIRCLLKLAGTPYWPDMQDKVLLLEARGGTVPQLSAFLSQLDQMGVFQKISGVLLGTFTQMEKEGCRPAMEALVMQYAGQDIPVVKTYEIGHGTDAKGIMIGKEIELFMGESAALKM